MKTKKGYIVPAVIVLEVESPELMENIGMGGTDGVENSLSGNYDESFVGGDSDFEWNSSPWEEETSW